MSSEVKIEEATGVLSGRYIPWIKEKYPFGKLTPARWENDDKTALTGPSFLIPRSENPPSVLAGGRKRYKHCTFVSRKVSEDGDIRVWLHPDSPSPQDRPLSTIAKTEAAPPAAKEEKKPRKARAAKTAAPAPAN